jgi:arylsulfatase A-like enzyme
LSGDKAYLADKLRLMYEEYLLAADAELGKFLDFLRERGLLEKSIVMISSDHGQAFAKRNLFHMSRVMYEQSLWIPLVVRLPGRGYSGRVKALTEQVDIMPTIVELFGGAPPAWAEGRSLVPFLQGKEPAQTQHVAYAASFPAVKELVYNPLSESLYAFVVYKWPYKLIRRFLADSRLNLYHNEKMQGAFFEVYPQWQLFDLDNDPLEETNIYGMDAKVTAELSALVEKKIKRVKQMREAAMR